MKVTIELPEQLGIKVQKLVKQQGINIIIDALEQAISHHRIHTLQQQALKSGLTPEILEKLLDE